MRRMLIGSTAAACALVLVSAGGAFARAGDRTARGDLSGGERTVRASAHDGHACRRSSSASKAAVVAACDTLQHAFGPLVSTVDAAECHVC